MALLKIIQMEINHI